MRGDNDGKSNDGHTGRTIWDLIRDFLRDHPIIALLIVCVVVLVLIVFLLLAWFGTEPGEMVTVVGIDLFRKPDISKQAEPAQSVISAETIEDIRTINGVRELSELEDNLSISRLPDGVFGFVPPWMINTDPVGVVGGTGFDKLDLNRTHGGTAVMEIHISSDAGQIYVVGYVSREFLLLLQDSSRNEPVDVILFFAPYGGRVPIGIPKDRIIESDNRRVDGDDGQSYYVNDMTVR